MRSSNGINYLIKNKNGNKEPILFIHGFPVDHREWSKIGDTGRTEIRVDLPGFGKSAYLPGSGSMEAYADLIHELLEELRLSRVVLCGHSMGGYVSLAFLAKYPSMMSGLVLVGSQTLNDTEEKAVGRRKMIEALRSHGISAVENFAHLLAAGGSAVDFFAPVIKEQDPLSAIWAIEAMIGRSDNTRLFNEADIPKLIIHGRSDDLVPFDETLFSKAHNLRIHLMDDVGHSPMVERPEEFSEVLVSWL